MNETFSRHVMIFDLLHHHWSGHLQYLRVSEVRFSGHPLTIHSHGNLSCGLEVWGWLNVDGSSPKSNSRNKKEHPNTLAYFMGTLIDLYPMTFNCSIMCSTGSASFFLHEEVYAATMLISVSSSVRIHSVCQITKLICKVTGLNEFNTWDVRNCGL